jgi:hypothetical protein
MIQELKKKVEKSAKPSINGEAVTHFNQLISYIDGSIVDSFLKEGDEKTKALLSHILVIRDYLTKVIGSNGLRQSLMTEVLVSIDALEAAEINRAHAESVEASGEGKKNEETYSIETNYLQESE